VTCRRTLDLTRRQWLISLAAVLAAGRVGATPGAGAFQPRLLDVGGFALDRARRDGAAHWAFELMRRTSAPALQMVSQVKPVASALLQSPFVLWSGATMPRQLSVAELGALREFLLLGGVLVVDDQRPDVGEFSRAAESQLATLLPGQRPRELEPTHVLYKSFYLLERPVGRLLGPSRIRTLASSGQLKVLFLQHDLLGALAREGNGWALSVEPGGEAQREAAIRFAVNLAMYLLCSDYKDDQVHASWLMRRRSRREP
jgi:hypothetical protein